MFDCSELRRYSQIQELGFTQAYEIFQNKNFIKFISRIIVSLKRCMMLAECLISAIDHVKKCRRHECTAAVKTICMDLRKIRASKQNFSWTIKRVSGSPVELKTCHSNSSWSWNSLKQVINYLNHFGDRGVLSGCDSVDAAFKKIRKIWQIRREKTCLEQRLLIVD